MAAHTGWQEAWDPRLSCIFLESQEEIRCLLTCTARNAIRHILECFQEMASTDSA